MIHYNAEIEEPSAAISRRSKVFGCITVLTLLGLITGEVLLWYRLDSMQQTVKNQAAIAGGLGIVLTVFFLATFFVFVAEPICQRLTQAWDIQLDFVLDLKDVEDFDEHDPSVLDWFHHSSAGYLAYRYHGRRTLRLLTIVIGSGSCIVALVVFPLVFWSRWDEVGTEVTALQFSALELFFIPFTSMIVTILLICTHSKRQLGFLRYTLYGDGRLVVNGVPQTVYSLERNERGFLVLHMPNHLPETVPVREEDYSTLIHSLRKV